MNCATYAPRVPAHPTRTGPRRTVPILWLVLHTSEGGEGDISAENLALYIARPRVVDPVTGKTINLASYHYIVDTDDVIPCVDDGWVAYAAGGGNAQGLHLCFPGKAAQTVEQWTDAVSADYLEQCARWLVDKSREYGIPLVKLTPRQLRSGLAGVCGHHDVSLAFDKSDHTDPGAGFPWDALIERARTLAAPPPPPILEPLEDPPMYIANLDGNLVLVGTSVRPISSDELDGRLGRLDVIDVDRDDPSWEWLDRARRKYADDLGLPA